MKRESGFEAERAEETPDLRTVLAHLTARHVVIRLWNSDLDWGLVWRTGQAGICVLDHERDQLRPIFDPTRGQSARRPRTWCLEGERVLRRHLAAWHVRAGVRTRGHHRLLRATFLFLDTVLLSMSHHQVLCVHACCLSVCLFARVV